MRRYLFLVLIASAALSACEGSRNNTSWSGKKEGTEVVPELQKPETHGAATADSTAADSVSAPADTTQVKH